MDKMIPKIIHYVWLSGDEKPKIYMDCLASWKKHLQDYEIKEWSINNLPKEVLDHHFVAAAIKDKKWAFATDFIRVWALYNYGGIYLDLDVEVFQSFDPFLRHAAFSCTEYNPRVFYDEIRKGKIDDFKGLNIEAAIMGAVPHHNWIKDIQEYYNNLEFSGDPQTMDKLIMPRIVSSISIKYGFRYMALYQILDEDIHIYPPDTFSFLFDYSRIKNDFSSLENCPIRFARHRVAHSWYEPMNRNSVIFQCKRLILNVIGKNNIDMIKKFFIKDKINI